MRIGIDARELAGRPTGAGRYLGGLLQEWQAARVPHEFVLYAAAPLALALDARQFATRLVSGTGGTWWEQLDLPRAIGRDHLDVWFAPAYTAPLRLQVPLVAAIHDLSFVAHPEWFTVREGMRRRWLVRRAAHQAAAVITISRFSRQELIDRLNVPAERIHVVPPGVGPGRSQTPSTTAPAIGGPHATRSPNPQSPSPHRVLYVGSIFNRRHVPDLIRAFAPIARSRPDAALDIVGDNRSHPRQDLRRTITAESLGDRVRWHEYVTDEQLRDLYAGARAFAFLSEYEGLGLTPLEALAAGVPPVLLDTTVARESCGDAALYVPYDVRAITSAIESALFDAATRARILVAAPAELAKFSWPRAAAETLAVVVGEGGRRARSSRA
jgi:glycosyltransferase involved in cell wall biosynthesis